MTNKRLNTASNHFRCTRDWNSNPMSVCFYAYNFLNILFR